MDSKRNIEFRYYEIPEGDLIFALTGSKWHKVYGEGKERLHFHNYYEVGICYEGEGDMILGEREVHFTPGCVSVIPPTELHTTNTINGTSAHWEWLYFDMLQILEQLYPEEKNARITRRYQLCEQGVLFQPEEDLETIRFLIQEIMKEGQDRKYMHRDVIRRFLEVLVIEIIRKGEHSDLSDGKHIKINIEPALDYVKKNFQTEIKISQLAKECTMSETHFRRTFIKYMNMKPLDYINFIRIQKSCAMLRDDNLPITEIASHVGYESASSYIRNFRKILGCTPYQWKKQDFQEDKYFKYNVTARKGWME